MLIYLLRHGLTEYNAQKRYQGQRDIPLSAEGLSQLRRADIDPKVVYITPLQRTAQTARVLFPEAELVVVKDLQEMLRQLRGQKLRRDGARRRLSGVGAGQLREQMPRR